ncbi:glycosyltransferase [Patescibacteria group bacterium]|nr:glycosyltransferase [Patescibacteria group bacterium]
MPKTSLKSKKPLVSIIIQTKNEQRTIGKLLKVLTEQTFKNFEIVVVDDNSTDKTLEIVNIFSKKLPIKILKIKPGEFSYSYVLNLGASKAKGKYLCSLVGHSLPFSKTWLADGLSNFKDPKIAGISAYYNEIPISYIFPKIGKLFFRPSDKKRLNFNPGMTNTCSIIRKDLWEKYPFDEKLPECEDYDWACEMLARGYNVVKDPRFNIFHSHLYLGQRINWFARKKRWKLLISKINKRKRPRESYTRLKLKSKV